VFCLDVLNSYFIFWDLYKSKLGNLAKIHLYADDQCCAWIFNWKTQFLMNAQLYLAALNNIFLNSERVMMSYAYTYSPGAPVEANDFCTSHRHKYCNSIWIITKVSSYRHVEQHSNVPTADSNWQKVVEVSEEGYKGVKKEWGLQTESEGCKRLCTAESQRRAPVK